MCVCCVWKRARASFFFARSVYVHLSFFSIKQFILCFFFLQPLAFTQPSKASNTIIFFYSCRMYRCQTHFHSQFACQSRGCGKTCLGYLSAHLVVVVVVVAVMLVLFDVVAAFGSTFPFGFASKMPLNICQTFRLFNDCCLLFRQFLYAFRFFSLTLYLWIYLFSMISFLFAWLDFFDGVLTCQHFGCLIILTDFGHELYIYTIVRSVGWRNKDFTRQSDMRKGRCQQIDHISNSSHSIFDYRPFMLVLSLSVSHLSWS